MFRNLFITTLRNFQRNRLFASLNLAGLTIGLTATLLIFLYISQELSFDKFHTNLDRIYRVNQTFIWGETDNLFGFNKASGVDPKEWDKPVFASPLLLKLFTLPLRILKSKITV